jgi:hypothetical protein
MTNRFKAPLHLLLILGVAGGVGLLIRFGLDSLTLTRLFPKTFTRTPPLSGTSSIGIGTAPSPMASSLPSRVPSTGVPTEAASPPSVTEQDRAQLQMLRSVLQSRNDNDPRLDSELRQLSPGARALFREEYRRVPAESRNERGTIVFLLGRNLETEEDFRFLQTVLSEPQCLSLTHCNSAPPRGDADDQEHHHSSLDATTLSYPQLVALKSLARLLPDSGGEAAPPATTPAAGVSAQQQNWSRDTLEVAARSSDPSVAKLARAMLERYR